MLIIVSNFQYFTEARREQVAGCEIRKLKRASSDKHTLLRQTKALKAKRSSIASMTQRKGMSGLRPRMSRVLGEKDSSNLEATGKMVFEKSNHKNLHQKTSNGTANPFCFTVIIKRSQLTGRVVVRG